MATIVVNKNTDKSNIYIGRGSKWGNPFTMKDKSDKERDRVCDEYEKYFWDSDLVPYLYELKDEILGCFCSPKRCHGDFLAKLCDTPFKYRIIIAGGRDFVNFDFMEEGVIETIVSKIGKGHKNEIEIVSGTANGADKLGERFAKKYNIKISKFPAKWNIHGKRAGYLRNKEMAEYGNMLIAFWDGKSKGTKHMIDLAEKEGLEVCVIRYYSGVLDVEPIMV